MQFIFEDPSRFFQVIAQWQHALMLRIFFVLRLALLQNSHYFLDMQEAPLMQVVQCILLQLL